MGNIMSVKLSDAEIELMSGAGRRDDRSLEPPESMNEETLQETAASLIAGGYAREIRAKGGKRVWRRDEEMKKSFALKLTAAGMKANLLKSKRCEVGQEVPPPEARHEIARAGEVSETIDNISEPEEAVSEAAPPADENAAIIPNVAGSPGWAISPRQGTKIATVLQMLRRDEGATLDEVIGATGWLPHTSRAALTGLRKRGYGIERRARTEGGFAYAVTVARQAQLP